MRVKGLRPASDDRRPPPPELTYTDLSVEVDPLEAPTHERAWQRRQRERTEAQVEAAALLEQMAASMGGILSLLKAAPTNDVLYTGTRAIPASGVDTLAWPAAASSLALGNAGSSAMTVTEGPPQGSAPSLGAGVMVVRPGIQRTFAFRGAAVSVYGTPGDLYDLTAFARPRDSRSGSIFGAPTTIVAAVPAPAAGADWSWQGPTDRAFRLVLAQTILTTSATVANRTTHLEAHDAAGQLLFDAPGSYTQPASQAGAFAFYARYPISVSYDGENNAPLPELWLPAGSAVGSKTNSMQAGDQWSAIVVTYEVA